MSHDLLLIVLSSLTSGGFVTGIGVLLKVWPERQKIFVDSASSVVVMQSSVIKELEDKIAGLETEVQIYKEKVVRLEKHLFDLDERITDAK
jgi:cysteine synthase